MLDRPRRWLSHIVTYLKARLEETSTKVAITTAIVSAAAMSAPWSYVFVAVSVIFAVIPTGPAKE